MRPIHFEIHASDPDRAVGFYTKVFGWGSQKWEGPADYWVLTTGPEGTPGINGAIMKRRGDEPEDGAAVNAFVCTINVTSLDTSLQSVTQNGGTVAVEKMPVPGVGWLAYCKDTEGNIFGMMQNDTAAA